VFHLSMASSCCNSPPEATCIHFLYCTVLHLILSHTDFLHFRLVTLLSFLTHKQEVRGPRLHSSQPPAVFIYNSSRAVGLFVRFATLVMWHLPQLDNNTPCIGSIK
jgi:hypothetical protein